MAFIGSSLGGNRNMKTRCRTTKVVAWDANSEENAVAELARMEQALTPLITSMKLFGLYHSVACCSKNIARAVTGEGNPAPCPRRKTRIALFAFVKTYCALTLVLLWLNLVRHTAGFFSLDNSLILLVTGGLWILQSVLLATSMFVTCAKRTHLQTFYHEWNKVFQGETARELELKPRYCRKFTIGATVFAWVIFAGNVTALCYLEFTDTSLGKLIIEMFSKPFVLSTGLKVIIVVSQVYLSAAWAFPPMFAVCLCHLIKSNFNVLAHMIDKHVSESEKKVPEHLEDLRLKHMQMCDAVAILDRSFMYLSAILYVTGIPMVCFVSYQLASVTMDTVAIAVNVFWIFVGFFGLLVASVMMAKVHDAAHAPLDSLFRVQPFNARPEQLGQMTLFLTKLTGTSVGFSVVNLFIITKELILTIGGLYITYFLLLLQFKLN